MSGGLLGLLKRDVRICNLCLAIIDYRRRIFAYLYDLQVKVRGKCFIFAFLHNLLILCSADTH